MNTGKPIRIAYFSDAPWVGGAEKYLFLLAEGLPREEFFPCLLVDDIQKLSLLAAWMRKAGIPVHVMPESIAKAGGLAKSIRTLASLSIDILHVNMPGPWNARYGLIAPLARLAGVRSVITTEHLPMIEPFAKGSLLKSIGTAFVDRVITVSEDNAKWLNKKHRVPLEKIRVVKIGIPEPPPYLDSTEARRELSFDENDFVCLIAASLEERKGHRFAIEALTKLPSNVKLLVAGRGPMEEPCRVLSEKLNLGARVRFVGFRDDINALISASDLVLVPSLLEATPFVIVEAMAHAKPVVASRIYGIPELVVDGETGILVDSAGVEQLIDAIGTLACDRDFALKLGAAGRRRYEKEFRIERLIEQTSAVYREVMRK